MSVYSRPVRFAHAATSDHRHDGRTYRFDGWERIGATKGRSRGGGTWTIERDDDHAAAGPKTLWHWSYDGDQVDDESEVA